MLIFKELLILSVIISSIAETKSDTDRGDDGAMGDASASSMPVSVISSCG